MVVLKKGTIIKGPDGVGYRAKESIDLDHWPISSMCFSGIGGLKDPIPGEVMPEWFRAKLFDIMQYQPPKFTPIDKIEDRS